MDKIKLLGLKRLEKVLVKTKTFQKRITRFWIQQKDDSFGRQRIGVDKFGNQYYQYYSYHGLPTKRIVLYKFFDTNCFHQDPHFVGWLR